MTRVLIVDDDVVQLRLTAGIAERAGFHAITATGGRQALDQLRSDPGIGAVILDLVMPEIDGMAVLEAMRREALSAPVIVQTAHSSTEVVATAMRHGAVDFFVKPVAPERLVTSLRNALQLRQLEATVRTARARAGGTMSVADVVTGSPGMARVLALAAKAAKSAIPVLIEGESGTGKELVARVIHGSGDRAGRPFVVLNCAAVSPQALEAVLFGERRSGAPERPGKFAEAQGGTLFLDEVGELPAELQARLVRVIETGEVQPVGAERPVRVNVRLVSATTRRLLNLARAGAFREDLYYRLNVLPIYLPPLRDRREDIPALATHFMIRFAAEAGKRLVGIADPALALLSGYNWPGNVRQLENAIYRAVALAEGTELETADFPQIVALGAGRSEAVRVLAGAPAPSAPVHIDDATVARREVGRQDAAPDRFMGTSGEVAALADVERQLIVFALAHYGYRMSRVARALGIGRSTLYRKLREYGLDDALESDAA